MPQNQPPPHRLRLHVLYEHGADLRPHSTAFIRLIRPLTHASTRGALDATFGRYDTGEPVDALVVDRLWRPDIAPAHVDALVAGARARGARVIQALDDNFPDLALDRPGWGKRDEVASMHRLARAADGLLVSTVRLRDRLLGLNANIAVVPNALDERLLDPRLVDPNMVDLVPPRIAGDDGDDRVVIGYMGTFTHDADLALVAPALREVCRRYPGRIQIELIGIAGSAATVEALADLPVHVIRLTPEQMAYPTFLPWFATRVGWDIALAPLLDTDFTRTKSDIKLLDYGAAGMAGVYSAVAAYGDTVRDGDTGLLAPNHPTAWIDALDRLVRNADLRARMGRAARYYVLAERTLAARGGDWVDAFRSLLQTPPFSSPSLDHAPPPQPAKAGFEDVAASSLAGHERHDHGPRPACPPSRPLRLVVLHEYGHGGEARPMASGHLRLIRPFQHPAAAPHADVAWSTRFDPHNVDAVIVDRLWRPDIAMAHVDTLVEAVRGIGAALVYALDDNLLDLPAERSDWPRPEHVRIVERLLAEADGVLVSSEALARRIAPLARQVAVVPNALDERLLGHTGPAPFETPFGPRPLVVGYMGTATHDDDLRMVLPALAEVCRRHTGRVEVECVGVVRQKSTRRLIEDAGVPVRFAAPHPAEAEYPLFMTWFTRRTQWDIAIAPLRDTPFRRCKSDIKFLDYCAIGAAGIYSRVAAYAGSVRDGETGVLADNSTAPWVDALERLIADADLRRHIASQARRYLFDERVLARRAPDWPAAIAGLIGA